MAGHSARGRGGGEVDLRRRGVAYTRRVTRDREDVFSDAPAEDPLPEGDDTAPLDPFEELVADALDAIPAPFGDRLGSVAIVIEDEPNAAQLASVGARGLFGLYQGVPRTRWSADGAPVPSKITIFRGPLERAYPRLDLLARAVEDTVFHEVAHHFGISDERLRELQGRGR